MRKEFKVGDKVKLRAPKDYGRAWEGVMDVVGVCADGWVSVAHPISGIVSFFPGSVELIEEEQPYALPADFRFFRRTDGAISEVPYPTFEAALEGWRGFAQNGDQTEIIELISHGTYKATLKVEVVEPVTKGA